MADGASSSSNDWCTIESDPGVFTELLQSIGCQTVELQELWSLDDDSLRELQQSTGAVYGLIFLFQWIGPDQREHASQKHVLPQDDIPPHLFFAQQITTNACATQAILSVLLNNVASDDDDNDDSSSNNNKNNNNKLTKQDLGDTLAEFHSFTASFGPHLKGVAISSSEQIKQAHNSFARPDGFLTDGDATPIASPDQQEAFHFVAYVPVNGIVYELDGLQEGPMMIGTYNDNNSTEHDNHDTTTPVHDWLLQARTAIQDRMAKAAQGHVKFNLMAVIQDKRVQLQRQLQAVAAAADSITTSSANNNVNVNNNNNNTTEPHHEFLLTALATEQAKREAWKTENQRRRHNYVPLCVQMLKELARMKRLPDLIEQAKQEQNKKRNPNQPK